MSIEAHSVSNCPSARRDLLAEEVDGETVILDRAGNRVHQLNATASFVWRQLDGETNLQQVVEAVAGHYDVDPSQALEDVEALIGDLQRLGLLEDGRPQN